MYCTLSDTGSHPLNSRVYVPDDFIFRGGHCRHKLGLWGAVTSPAVPGMYRDSRVSPFVGSGHGDWVRIMTRQDAMAAALQLQHDADLMSSNLQVLGQYVTSRSCVWPSARNCSPRRQLTLRPWCPECITQLSRCPLWGYGAHHLARVFPGQCLCLLTMTVCPGHVCRKILLYDIIG